MDEGVLPEAIHERDRTRSRSETLRDQLDRYGEPELVAERWRGAVDDFVRMDDARCERRRLLSSPRSAESARALTFGVDDPRHAR